MWAGGPHVEPGEEQVARGWARSRNRTRGAAPGRRRDGDDKAEKMSRSGRKMGAFVSLPLNFRGVTSKRILSFRSIK
jgi:hypothetical protein